MPEDTNGGRRRVLVVAYYFPPMGLSGVQRVAKFVKYLPAYGWDPEVLTVEPAGYFAFDESLLAEIDAAAIPVHRTQSLDPTLLFGKQSTVRLPGESSRRKLSYLSQFLFIPDNKIGWAIPAFTKGRGLLKARRFDAILSSAPPYTGHLVAALLSRSHDLPLVLDFRDDWVGNPRHVYPTRLHRRLHEWLERFVLTAADRVLTINTQIADSLESRSATDVSVLPQGFDPADFHAARTPAHGSKMCFVHSGIFYDVQTPNYFLLGLAEFIRRRPEARNRVEAVFVGLFPENSRHVVQDLDLSDLVREIGYVPHSEVPAHLLAADVLWMTVGRRVGAECISTSKLFEYFGARKPILALVPAGAAQQALERHGAATVAPPEDVERIADAVEAFFDQWSRGHLARPDESYIRGFDRKTLAGALAEYLEASVEERCRNSLSLP